jgi:hypothetical protein
MEEKVVSIDGRCYELVDITDEVAESDQSPEEQPFYLPTYVVQRMAFFCRYNNTQRPM